MTNQGPFDNNNQFVVSYELLQLLQWLIDYEQEPLKKLITRSLHNGLQNHLNNPMLNPKNQQSIEELQLNVVDFFALLEVMMHEIVNEDEVTNILQRTMLPAIDHIDSSMCDNNTMAVSIAKARTAVENKTGENPKDVLCKELLKRWKPSKKPYAH